MKKVILILGVLSVTGAIAAEVCDIHPLVSGKDGAAAHCTNPEDGRALNSAEMPKIAVIQKLLKMGYVSKNETTFTKQ